MSTVPPPVCESLSDANILALILLRAARDSSGYILESLGHRERYIKWENKTFNSTLATVWEHMLSRETQVEIVTEFVAYKLGAP